MTYKAASNHESGAPEPIASLVNPIIRGFSPDPVICRRIPKYVRPKTTPFPPGGSSIFIAQPV